MAVNTYSAKKNGSTYLSAHFQVKEFQCHNGADTVLVNTDLITILEKLFTKMNAKAINIVSGYRTPAYSPTVGGYSTDQHTKGNAADITVKKQDGSYYTSNEICCALEDLNHQGGVGRINKTYNVHVDVRGSKCWFDETASMKTLDSWYSYLGIKKPATTASESSTKITKGSLVKIASNATYYGTGVIPSWVLKLNWYVDGVSGDRAVLDKSEDGKYSISSPVNTKYLTVVKKAATTTTSTTPAKSETTSTTKTETKTNSPLKGIDLSVHNGTDVDFNKVKKAGISFVILRAGYGRSTSQKDSTFEENYKRAKAAGLMVGAYWYSYATDVEGAKAEFNTFMKVIKGKQFEMPLYYDVEENRQFNTGKQNVSNMISTFLSACESAGYFAGLYMSRSQLMTYVTDEIQKKYTLWVAEYGSKCNYSGAGRAAMWQNSETGKVNGVTGNVDTNYLYEDFVTKIKDRGLNGFEKFVKGDVDGDGKVTSKDARKALRAAGKLEKLTDDEVKRGDMDGDGDVDSSDARKILRQVAGLDSDKS